MKQLILSDNVSPLHYNLFIEPDLINFRFRGTVNISVQLKKPLKKITLNSHKLKITNSIIIANNKEIKPKIRLSEKDQAIDFLLPNRLSGSVILKTDFSGILDDSLIGFYRSRYFYKGKEKYLATTQFEAPYARKCFPCFDSPDKKATFSLSLAIPENLQAISNMPQLSQTMQKDKKLILFEKTPQMSTYLLYFGIGEFEFIETKFKNTKIRVVTTPGKANQGKFALDMTKKFLEYFEDYSKIPYPLPKLDLIAIPDFGAAAMENWGAITFREIVLLFDEKNTSLTVKKRIAEVIAHELWHQWSGNLVTMKWWDDLWLNESFATYMAFKALNHYFPEWKVILDFVTSNTENSLIKDSLKTTHSIAAKVKVPNEIEEIFDSISYGKGGSVLRMIENYLGEDKFRLGVSNYLKKFQYQNAVASDLWDSLAKVSNNPVKSIMKSWINQSGYPLIGIKEKGSHLILAQKRFNSNSSNSQTWLIPLSIHSKSSCQEPPAKARWHVRVLEHSQDAHYGLKPIGSQSILMSQKILLTSTNSLNFHKSPYMLNNGRTGFFRIDYPQSNIEKLRKEIENKSLSALDRNSIQSDIFNLAWLNKKPISSYLDLLKAYKNEDDYSVLQNIFSNIYKIYQIFSSETFWPDIEEHFFNLISKPFLNAFSQLQWNPKESESNNEKMLRPLLISYLSLSKNEKVIRRAKEIFNSKTEQIHPDIKGPLYSAVARNGGMKDFSSLLKIYSKSSSPEEKVKILAALYKFQDKKILKKALDFALSSKVRTQDIRTIFASISTNPLLKDIFFNWTKNNWKKIEKLKKTHYIFEDFLTSLITIHTEKKKVLEIRKFLKSKKITYEKTKANAFEISQINSVFLNKNKNILKSYFKN